MDASPEYVFSVQETNHDTTLSKMAVAKEKRFANPAMVPNNLRAGSTLSNDPKWGLPEGCEEGDGNLTQYTRNNRPHRKRLLSGDDHRAGEIRIHCTINDVPAQSKFFPAMTTYLEAIKHYERENGVAIDLDNAVVTNRKRTIDLLAHRYLNKTIERGDKLIL